MSTCVWGVCLCILGGVFEGLHTCVFGVYTHDVRTGRERAPHGRRRGSALVTDTGRLVLP